MEYLTNYTQSYLYHKDDSERTVIFPLLGEFTFLKHTFTTNVSKDVKQIYENSFLICGFHSKLPQITSGNK